MWVWVREIVSSQDHQGAHVGGCGCAKSYQAKIIRVRMWVGVGARNVKSYQAKIIKGAHVGVGVSARNVKSYQAKIIKGAHVGVGVSARNVSL